MVMISILVCNYEINDIYAFKYKWNRKFAVKFWFLSSYPMMYVPILSLINNSNFPNLEIFAFFNKSTFLRNMYFAWENVEGMNVFHYFQTSFIYMRTI